jgi:hypothetical protein
MDTAPRDILNRRIAERPQGLLDVRANLCHFVLVNYAVPKDKLQRYIPADRFEIPEFEINGSPLAFISAVPLYVYEFRFVRLAPFFTSHFAQTNYRAYVIDPKTNEYAVWFFGSTLGSRFVHVAQTLWGVPWHYGTYRVDCTFNEARGVYDRYVYDAKSEWCNAEVQLKDTGEPISVMPGFSSLDEMRLIITHGDRGFYRRRDGGLGRLSVWHREIPLTQAEPQHLYFSLFEDLGLLSKEEMERSHSVFLCPKVEFDIHMPPKKVEGTG